MSNVFFCSSEHSLSIFLFTEIKILNNEDTELENYLSSRKKKAALFLLRSAASFIICLLDFTYIYIKHCK